MSSGDFGVNPLQSLIKNNNIELLKIFTSEAKPFGRGLKLKMNIIDQIAKTNKIDVCYTKTLKDKIIQDKNVLDLIYKKVEVEKPWIHPYYMGIYEESYRELKGYGHGGFWGTKVIYFPKIDTSISVFILERDKKDLQPIIINRIIDVIN